MINFNPKSVAAAKAASDAEYEITQWAIRHRELVDKYAGKEHQLRELCQLLAHRASLSNSFMIHGP